MLNILKSILSAAYWQMTVTGTYSNLLITRTGINSQMSSKFGYIFHFPLELPAFGLFWMGKTHRLAEFYTKDLDI